MKEAHNFQKNIFYDLYDPNLGNVLQEKKLIILQMVSSIETVKFNFLFMYHIVHSEKSVYTIIFFNQTSL